MLSCKEFGEKTKDSRFFNLAAGVDVWLVQAILGRDEGALLRLVYSDHECYPGCHFHGDACDVPLTTFDYILDYYILDDDFSHVFFLCRQMDREDNDDGSV